MLKPFRTNRPLTRFIAMAIVIASAFPFIGHACMMAEAHAMPTMKQCCCDEAHGMHEGMEMMGSECEEEQEHGTTLHDDCCSVDFQSADFDALARNNKASPEELVVSALILLPAYVFFEPALEKAKGELQDTGPPLSPPLSLHILHSRFLN